jgi:hypothetical protein
MEQYKCYQCGQVLECPDNSEVWCDCHPRVKNKMINMSKILRKEMRLNKQEQYGKRRMAKKE